MKPAYHPIYPTPKIEDRDRKGEFVKSRIIINV